MADISKIKLPNGDEYNFKDSTARANSGVTGVKGNAESSYRTGQVNLTAENIGAFEQLSYARGTTEAGIRPYVNTCRANRLAFLPASQIIIEKTTDGGATWIDAGYNDAQKIALFSENGSSIQIPLLNNAKSVLCGVRVTITGMKYDVPNGTAEVDKYGYWNSSNVITTERYFNVREWWFWLIANNDTIRPYIYCATGGNPNNWITVFNTDFGMTGWSGSDWIRAGSGKTFGGGTNQTNNYWNWRLVFWSKMADGKTSFQSATVQSISQIRCFGDSVWTASNQLMSKDHLYSWDNTKNVTFPANVTASSFSGDVSGSATTLKSNGRLASANNNYHDGKMRYYIASASMTTGKPPEDAEIIHLPWDNSGWDTQIALSTTPRMYIRKEDGSGNWDSWKMVYTDRETIPVTNGGTGATTAANARTNLGLGTAAVANLSTSTSSTSTTTAATSSAVKTAYDLANTANGTAYSALSGVNGNLIYDHTFTISNGIATFTPHVYQKGVEVTTNYAVSCFVWKYRLIDGSEVTLTTKSDRGCDVTISVLGYGGHIIGAFTPPE